MIGEKMLRLIKSEFLKGYILAKILIVSIWSYLVAAVIAFMLTPGSFAEKLRPGELHIFIIILILITLLTVFGGRFVFSVSCVPYWGRYFSLITLSKLLRNEQFERVEVDGLPKVRNIWESENWLMISNCYFYKPLCTRFLYSTGYGTVPSSAFYTFINGYLLNTTSTRFFADAGTNQSDQITRLVGKKIRVSNYNGTPESYRQHSKAIFKELWKGSLRSFTRIDIVEFRKQWDARMKERYGHY